MKRILVCIPLLALLMLTGCEKRLFHFIATITQSPTFPINAISGAFQSLPIPVVSSVIQNAVAIPAGGQITRVDIESLALHTMAKSGNQVDSVKVTGIIIEAGVPQRIFGVETIIIGGVDAPLVALKTLNAAGINQLRIKLEGFIKNTDNQPFAIQLSGDLMPSGRRLTADFKLVVTATAKYDQCLEVPGLFSSGEKCGE